MEQQKERMYQRKSMHFKVFCQQYDIYNKMGENQLANTRIVPYHSEYPKLMNLSIVRKSRHLEIFICMEQNKAKYGS